MMERKGKSRLNKIVKAKFGNLTNRQVSEAIEHGLVVDKRGKAFAKGTRISDESGLVFDKLISHIQDLQKGNPALNVAILHSRDGYLIVDKPPGMASQPISLFDRQTITNWALAHYPGTKCEFTDIQPILVPHRLDAGTSGLLVVCLTKQAFDEWRVKFQKKMLAKKYLAWCWGIPNKIIFEINSAIAHDPSQVGRMVLPAEGVPFRGPVMEAQSLVTVRSVDQKLGVFLAEISCTSGVTHQVRVHLASLGHPLIGDSIYDPQYQAREFQRPHHLLRAFSLEVDNQIFVADTVAFEKMFAVGV